MGNISRLSMVFISTLLTPHQIPFCDEMAALCSSFVFYQVNVAGDEWISKGERIERKDYSYLKQFSWTSECMRSINNADIVLIGSCDLSLVEDRLKAGKIVFIYLERFYKKGITVNNFVRCIGGTYIHHGRYQKYNVHLLCAGAYCAGDAAIFGNYVNKTYKWGYFPKFVTIESDICKIPNQIIWVGRLIDWKHPEHAVEAIKGLAEYHPDVVLKILGAGTEEKRIRNLIQELHLDNNVKIMGGVSSDVVKREMMRSAVFLSTSDFQEGWGAVLNEAMNCKCAIVASHAAGSTPFLIKNGINGLIYESGNISQIVELCRRLLDDYNYLNGLANQAYITIRDLWNPKQAARRFFGLSEALLNGKKTPYEDGPCSIAIPIRQKDMYVHILGE